MTGLNLCDGCADCLFPGIRWPTAADGCDDHAYVERCDACERYSDDETAAKFLAAVLGRRWGYAERENPDNVRWEPAEGDGLDYTGWSAFIASGGAS